VLLNLLPPLLRLSCRPHFFTTTFLFLSPPTWPTYSFRLLRPSSKTDIKLFRQSPPVCPFSATLAFHTVHPFRTGPFFRFCSGDYLTRSAFVALLRSVFPSQSSLNSHSFRIGGASALAAAGIPDFEIRILGRWSSDSFLRYIRLRPSSLRDHQSRMRHAPSS